MAEWNMQELVLYVDDDDPQLWQYREWTNTDPTIELIVGPRVVLSQTWNECAKRAAGNIMWHGNDDVLFRSEKWDEQVRKAFDSQPDKILLVHGRDGYHDERMSVLGFLHRRWIEEMGYFVPPYFVSDYNDQWLSEVADALGRRRFLPEVYTEHMHPNYGKGPMDQTHAERIQRHMQENVDQLYAQLAPERREWANRLRKVMS